MHLIQYNTASLCSTEAALLQHSLHESCTIITFCVSFEEKKTCCFHLHVSVGLWWCFLYTCVSSYPYIWCTEALRFITNLETLMQLCMMHVGVRWFPLSFQRLAHWFTLIYKVILGLLPPYLLTYSHQTVFDFGPKTHSFCLSQRFAEVFKPAAPGTHSLRSRPRWVHLNGLAAVTCAWH